MKRLEARIYADKGVKPIFHKARSAPYFIREKIETELAQLVTENIFQPVEYSEWPSPIVPAKNLMGPQGFVGITKFK